jgi:hypothetical protein
VFMIRETRQPARYFAEGPLPTQSGHSEYRPGLPGCIKF